jgi:hypothetical protein
MTNAGRQDRLKVIAFIRSEASKLLKIAADETVKAQIRAAIRGLDAAAEALRSTDNESAPSTVKHIDREVDNAAVLMGAITNALARHGRDVTWPR